MQHGFGIARIIRGIKQYSSPEIKKIRDILNIQITACFMQNNRKLEVNLFISLSNHIIAQPRIRYRFKSPTLIPVLDNFSIINDNLVRMSHNDRIIPDYYYDAQNSNAQSSRDIQYSIPRIIL
jgi:hypothetical protein